MSSLRHYETIGLLTPEYIGQSTGFRYYSARQFEVLNTIRYLRVLDMPLSEIADFLQNKDVELIEEKLRQQKETVVAKQQELKRIERKIDNRLKQLWNAQNSVFDTVRLISVPSCRIVWVQTSLKIRGFLDLETSIRELEQSQAEAVAFLGKVGVGISEDNLRNGRFTQYDSIFLVLDEEDRFDGDTLTLPETFCASIRFRGSHAEAPEQYQKLMMYICEHKMQVNGFSREITMIDYGITNDTDKFVTEIDIPVVCK